MEKAELFCSVVIVVLLAIDVALTYHMVYGCYPWEGTTQ